MLSFHVAQPDQIKIINAMAFKIFMVGKEMILYLEAVIL